MESKNNLTQPRKTESTTGKNTIDQNTSSHLKQKMYFLVKKYELKD